MRVGILSLQGAVEPHADKLRLLGAEPVMVLRPNHLENLDGIILPGGESTTMLHLLHLQGLWQPMRDFVAKKPAWGVCAGSILLAKKVTSPVQHSLEAMDIEVERNAYGRQINSFIAPLVPAGDLPPIEGVFIRAPRIRSVFGETKVLYHYRNEPVMVEDRNLLASTFHPELSEGTRAHEYFLRKCNG